MRIRRRRWDGILAGPVLDRQLFYWVGRPHDWPHLDALVTFMRDACLKPNAAKKSILTTQTKPASTFKTLGDAELEI